MLVVLDTVLIFVRVFLRINQVAVGGACLMYAALCTGMECHSSICSVYGAREFTAFVKLDFSAKLLMSIIGLI